MTSSIKSQSCNCNLLSRGLRLGRGSIAREEADRIHGSERAAVGSRCPLQKNSFLQDAKKSFWEHRGSHWALSCSALFGILFFGLYAHDVTLGSFWCPLSLCQELQNSTLPESLRAQLISLSVLCLLLDIYVLHYHVTEPVHPKFVLLSSRRFVMKLHILSGCVQCLAWPHAMAALESGWIELAKVTARAISIWGILVHVPTSLYLLRTAFGAVRFMMPGFLHATTMYAYTLWRLWICSNARLEQDLLTYWLLLHVYVFNRVTFGLLTKFNILANARYSISILVGLSMAVPPALGCIAMFSVVGAVVIFNLAFLYFMDQNVDSGHGELYSAGGLANEALMSKHFVAPEGMVVAPRLKSLRADGSPHSNRELARIVFKHLESNSRKDFVELNDIARLLVGWGLPASEALAVLKQDDENGDGHIDFDEFFKNLKAVWEFAARITMSNSAVHPGAD